MGQETGDHLQGEHAGWRGRREAANSRVARDLPHTILPCHGSILPPLARQMDAPQQWG